MLINPYFQPLHHTTSIMFDTSRSFVLEVRAQKNFVNLRGLYLQFPVSQRLWFNVPFSHRHGANCGVGANAQSGPISFGVSTRQIWDRKFGCAHKPAGLEPGTTNISSQGVSKCCRHTKFSNQQQISPAKQDVFIINGYLYSGIATCCTRSLK